jgi:hypothetical protein
MEKCVACIATGHWLDGRGSIPSRGKRFFSTPSRPDLRPTQPIINGYGGGADSPGVKQPLLEADYSPQSSADVRNYGAILFPMLPWYSA